MTEPIIVPAATVNQAVYVSLAVGRADPVIDIVAGVTVEMLLARPGLSGDAIRAAVAEVHGAVVANRPDPALDLSPNDVIRTTRVLLRVVPTLTGPAVRDGARRYSRAFLASARRGAGQLRQVAPLDLQFDRVGEVDRFRHDTWLRLHQLAKGRAAVAQAIDQGPIATALGFETRHNATAILERVQQQPLRDFVLGHLRPNGSLSVELVEFDTVLENVGGRVRNLRDSYVANLVEINRAEQQARDAAAPVSVAAESALEAAIKKAEQKQKELDELLANVISGTNATAGVLAFMIRGADEEFASDILEFASITTTLLTKARDFGKAAIGTAKMVGKLASAGASGLALGGAIGFSVVMVALMIQSLGLFKSRTKPINVVILEELRKIAQQLTDLRNEMRTRFDRVERQLAKVYAGILDRLAAIDFTLGQVRGDVGELQLSLYNLHGELQRLNRDVHAFLDAGFRRDLVEAINGFLNFAERTGQPLNFEGFGEAENLFFSWGRDHAKDALQAGPTDRRFGDDDLVRELTALPLAANVNYVRELPAQRFNLPPIAANRLANPFDWLVAAEAYAQLGEESPDHIQRISPARIQALVDVGEDLGESLSRIADHALFCAFAVHYQSAFARVKTAINIAERTYRDDPANGLFGIDLWGGADQEPARHFFRDDFDEIPRCDGKPFDADSVTAPTNVFPFDVRRLRPFMIASNLSSSRIPEVSDGLARLGACVQATWRLVKREELGVGGLVRLTYRLTITVRIRYGTSNALTFRFDTPEPFGTTVRRDEEADFDPAGQKDPHSLLLDTTKRMWSKLDEFPLQTTLNTDLLTRTTALVQEKLMLAQRGFYAEVARHFGASGDVIQLQGDRLTGSRLLWQTFVTTGLPLSIEANEILRSLLFGSEAILAGAGGGQTTGRIDNVRDIYALFSSRREDPPPTNILADIESLAKDRLQRLTQAVSDRITDIQNTGQPEPPELFAPTLFRLSLLSG